MSLEYCLTEINHTEKRTGIEWSHLYKVPKTLKSMETDSRMVTAKDWGRGERGVDV